MIRLLHTADVHLGRQFPALRNRASDYRTQLLRTFEKIIDLAGSERVSLLLIAGDLFDSNRMYGITTGRVLAAFRKLGVSDIRVCLIPGTHDPFGGNSIYKSLYFPRNVTVLNPEHLQQTYEDLSLTVYGIMPDNQSSPKSPLQNLSLDQNSRFHVGIAHGSIKNSLINEKQSILDEKDIATSGLDYLALGHWHSFQDFSLGKTRVCYSGSPEPIDMDQMGAGNVALVTLDENKAVEIQPIRVSTKKFETLNIDVSPIETIDGITRIIEARADPNLILKVTLSGFSHVDFELNSRELENLLRTGFFHLRILDSSHPKLEKVKSQNYPEKTVIGRFLRIMEEKIALSANEEDKALYEEALKLGFTLLQGRSQVLE